MNIHFFIVVFTDSVKYFSNISFKIKYKFILYLSSNVSINMSINMVVSAIRMWRQLFFFILTFTGVEHILVTKIKFDRQNGKDTSISSLEFKLKIKQN